MSTPEVFPLLPSCNQMNLLRILDTQPAPVLTTAHWPTPPESYIRGKNYTLVTPARHLQMELQDQIVSLHYSDILKFFNASPAATQIAKESLITMVSNSLIICSHPYLLIEHYFPKSLTTRDIPKRLCDTSGKFQMVSDLLVQMALTGRNLNVCIIGLPNKMLDLIDALCMGHRCNIIRHKGIKLRDSMANKKVVDTVNVHIIGSDFVSSNDVDNDSIKFDFVLNMDSMADVENNWLKSHCTSSTVFIELLTSNSIEHICHHFLKNTKKSIGNLDPFLNDIVAAMVVLREKIGHIPSGIKPAYTDNLAYLRPYIANPNSIEWSLPDMSKIGKYTSNDVEKSLLREVKIDESDDEAPVKKEKDGKFFDGGYYLEKRLEKKYLSNPLLGGYAHLTGISREVSGGEVLTHTLMFDYESVLTEWGKMNSDLKAFENSNDIRITHWEESKEELIKMKALVTEKDSQLEGINKEISENDAECEITRESIKDFERRIEEMSKNEIIGDFVKKDQMKHELLSQISKLESKLESSKNETKYMNEEIERAQKSINESDSNMSVFEQRQSELKIKIDDLISNSKVVDDSSLRNELEAAEQECAQLTTQISVILNDINNPNVRHRTAPKRNFKR